jgi:hypothetical protein
MGFCEHTEHAFDIDHMRKLKIALVVTIDMESNSKSHAQYTNPVHFPSSGDLTAGDQTSPCSAVRAESEGSVW